MANNIINISLLAISLFSVIYCLGSFAYFISLHSIISGEVKSTNLNNDGQTLADALGCLKTNLMVLICFVAQHSIMATTEVKQYFSKLGLQVAMRSVYNMCTSAALILVMHSWQPVPWFTLWLVDTTQHVWSWWIFTLLHSLAWYIIYSGAIMMDFLELVGIKQVYYKIKGLEDPLKWKSDEMCRLYRNMRHPSFTAFCILFWLRPVMSLDRLLLAVVLTIFMATAWTVDTLDHNYQRTQRSRKICHLTPR